MAGRYRMTVEEAWEANGLGSLPALTNAVWIMFPPLDETTMHKLAVLARIDVVTLDRIQTPEGWMTPRRRLPYCYRCLVINPVDVSTPYWRRAWLDPAIRNCGEHGTPLETVPPFVFHRGSVA
ncbi:hypothetical protein LGN06_28325 [Burkholderia vietnamiensis]|nr:hypothetical protein [Burkholderia vietnamiensis]MCA8462949.1 hypothetical protein [Burkholderia multivorans]MCA8184159.1 hypothetical protein [Burkholderia vietnamiensis]MCA8395460.1 hypothetical protein [Burkholderia vietnamiensis]MCB4347856.1 hypothetical protein [Burkholderia vietnamiensis]